MKLFTGFGIIPYGRIPLQMKTPVGLIFDNSCHYIDHLGPFCVLYKWPLIVCEGQVADLARRYYPNLEVIEINRWDLDLPPLIISCYPRGLIESVFSVDPSRKLFWLPHGNSDKGWKIPFFEPLRGEITLVYGQRMIDFMQKKNVISYPIRVGNFRLQYWIDHRAFYDRLIQEMISLPKTNKTYLYAPTWNDSEGNGSFWEMFPMLAVHLPNECNLIVKIHPNTEREFAPECERLVGKYATRSNIYFLFEFPPIYPLLDICDVYIGDMSSIGYDFLYWNRPMYFLKSSSQTQFLYRCGSVVAPEKIESIFHPRHLDRKEFQTQVYDYTFDPHSPNELIRYLEEEE